MFNLFRIIFVVIVISLNLSCYLTSRIESASKIFFSLFEIDRSRQSSDLGPFIEKQIKISAALMQNICRDDRMTFEKGLK